MVFVLYHECYYFSYNFTKSLNCLIYKKSENWVILGTKEVLCYVDQLVSTVRAVGELLVCKKTSGGEACRHA